MHIGRYQQVSCDAVGRENGLEEVDNSALQRDLSPVRRSVPHRVRSICTGYDAFAAAILIPGRVRLLHHRRATSVDLLKAIKPTVLTSSIKTVSTCHPPETVQGTHVFDILGYSKHRGLGAKSFVQSSVFTVGRHHWALRLYPEWADDFDFVSVYLSPLSSDAKVTVSCDLRLIDPATGMSKSWNPALVTMHVLDSEKYRNRNCMMMQHSRSRLSAAASYVDVARRSMEGANGNGSAQGNQQRGGAANRGNGRGAGQSGVVGRGGFQAPGQSFHPGYGGARGYTAAGVVMVAAKVEAATVAALVVVVVEDRKAPQAAGIMRLTRTCREDRT
ncbi:hypothetical protein EJB05_09017, partial [Eragrostis curvula]